MEQGLEGRVHVDGTFDHPTQKKGWTDNSADECILNRVSVSIIDITVAEERIVEQKSNTKRTCFMYKMYMFYVPTKFTCFIYKTTMFSNISRPTVYGSGPRGLWYWDIFCNEVSPKLPN
uniref:Uncharacterized protein n=1 Tax=Cacopsylla melanoneura TaxID=428564 RepID=A0A8D9E970_9HEMI